MPRGSWAWRSSRSAAAGRPAPSARCASRRAISPRYGVESAADHVSGEAEREQSYRLEKGLLPGCRMSCAALVQGDVLVTVPEESQAHKQVVRKAATERAIQINPAARLCYVELPPASLEDERSDWARLADELAARFGLERDRLRIDFAILPSLQPALAGRPDPARRWPAWCTA